MANPWDNLPNAPAVQSATPWEHLPDAANPRGPLPTPGGITGPRALQAFKNVGQANLAALINPLSHLSNRFLGTNTSDIPIGPDTNPLISLPGSIASFAIPYGGEMKVLGAVGRALPEAAKLAEKVPGFLRTAAATGAVGGATAPKGEATKNAAIMAALGGTGDLIGGFGRWLGKPFAAHAELERALPSVDETAGDRAFTLAQANKTAQRQNISDRYENVSDLAQKEGDILTPDYKLGLGKLSKDYAAKTKGQSGFKKKYEPALNLLTEKQADVTGNVNDLLNHYKSLNADYSVMQTPQGSMRPNIEFSTLNNARALARKEIAAKASPTLAKAFSSTNKLNAEHENLFGVNQKGTKSAFAKLQARESRGAPYHTNDFINEFTPKKPADGIEQMQRFAKVVGDENASKDAIKSNLFQDLLTEKDPLLSFKKGYGKLSNSQRTYLFGDDAKSIDKAFENAKGIKARLHFSLGGHILPQSESVQALTLPGVGALAGSALGYSSGGLGGAVLGGAAGGGAGLIGNAALLAAMRRSPALAKYTLGDTSRHLLGHYIPGIAQNFLQPNNEQ